MAWDEQSASTGLDECAALVRSAEALCSGAPELAVQLAQRALAIGTGVTARDPMAFADIGQARSLSMRAQAVLAGGLVRISHHTDAVEPAFAALALAEVTSATEFAAAVRLDLAVCAREVGEPVLGGAVLRPVLESADVRPAMRALALSRLVTCVGHLARRDDLEDALGEADRLVAADDRLSPDARRVERARLSVRTAAYHRWYGDTEDAVAAAKAGLGMLSRLRRELRAECDRLRAQLVLELVCALLDEGELAEAESAAESVVGEPVRATSAAAVGQLMLAVSTRVLLPSGQVGRGREMLAQSVWMAERHGLDALLADSLTELSHLDEQAGRTTDALEALRSARAAEQRRMRAITRASRLVLTEIGAADVGAKAVTSLLRQASRPGHTVPAPHATRSGRLDFAADAGSLAARTETDETPTLLNREALFRRLRSVRNGERPVALTLLRFEPVNELTQATGHRADTDIDLTELAGRVRAIAPDNAELASSAGDELAVFLPHTTRDQAERFAATIRETARATDWPADTKGNDLSISTGVVQSTAPTTEDETVDAGALLTAARHALGTPEPTRRGSAEPRAPRPTRLHAAGTTAADRQDLTSHPSHSAEPSNTTGTQSGYFPIPTPPAATTEPEPRTGTYATDTGAGPTSPSTAASTHTTGPSTGAHAVGEGGDPDSAGRSTGSYAAGEAGGPGMSTGSFAAGTGSGSYAVPAPGPAETARDAAASASEAADTAREVAARSTGARRRARSADTPFGDDEEPTRPLPNVAGASESLTVGRAILSSLSIPKGSGGRRRAPGEQTANNLAPHAGDPATGWSTTPGPRATGEQEPGWPQTPGPRAAGENTHGWQSWSTTPDATDPHTGWPPSTANQSTTDSQNTDQQPDTAEPAAPDSIRRAGAESAPTAGSDTETPAGASSAWDPSPADSSASASGSGGGVSAGAGSVWGSGAADSSAPTSDSAADGAVGTGSVWGSSHADSSAPADTGAAWGGGAGDPGTEATSGTGSADTGSDRPADASTGGWASGASSDEPAEWGTSAESTGAQGGLTGTRPRDADPMDVSRWGPGAPGSSADQVRASAEEQRSAYEQTKAELARMMSELTGGSPEVTPGGTTGTASIPTPPDPDSVPEPSRRSEIPEPPEPDPIPPTPDEPQPVEPGPPPASEPLRETATTSALRAALEPFGGIPERSGPPEVPRTSRPPGSARSAGATGSDRPAGSVDTGAPGSGEASGTGEAATSTAASWSAESSKSSQADWSADAGGTASPAEVDSSTGPAWSAETARPLQPDVADEVSRSTRASRTAEVAGSAAIDWSADISRSVEVAGSAQAGQSAGPTQSGMAGEVSGSAQASRPAEAGAAGSARVAEVAGSAAIDWSADITRSAETAPADAPELPETGGETHITTPSDEPIIGPLPRPPDAPGSRRETGRQRGDRSDSTTIAGLLAEALAAYQSTADDEDDYHPPRHEPAPRPPIESFGGLDTFADSRVHGRHRSPE